MFSWPHIKIGFGDILYKINMLLGSLLAVNTDAMIIPIIYIFITHMNKISFLYITIAITTLND